MAFPDTTPTDTAQQQAAEVQPGQLRGRTAVTCKHNWIPAEFGHPQPRHYMYVCKRCHKTIAAQLKETQ